MVANAGSLTHEALVEEARLILKTLQRDDLFDERVRLTEAEKVLGSSLSLSFGDYCAFLNKFGYVRIDASDKTIAVTQGGAQVAQALDDADFNRRISRHFERNLSGQPTMRGSRSDIQASDTGVRAVRATSTGLSNIGTGLVNLGAGPSAVDDVLDRRYRRGQSLGQGTVGTVYHARHVSLGRNVAIKEARGVFQMASYLRRDEIVRRLRMAVEAHARLEHPGVVQIVDQNTEREYPYFVMELAGGGNLRQRMTNEAEGRLDLGQAVRVMTQVSYALAYAHEQGVLHLGLKPENVLFDHLGNVKLTDFGFARITERDDDASQPMLVGGNSLAYFSPERLQPTVGRRPEATAASDIYALGLLFYEMITGRLPGRRSPLPSQARKDVPSAFDDVFDLMTRDDVSERYHSVEQVLEGIYKAFPSKEVYQKGTILLWANDPKPLPVPEMVEEPAENGEIATGEIDVRAIPPPVPPR